MLKGNCSCGFVCPDCGQEPCQCQKENVCSKCGTPYCNGECAGIDDGKGESGGGGEPDDIDTPIENTTITYDEKSKVEIGPKLDTLKKDCMGSKLLNSFNGLSFRFDGSLKALTVFSPSTNTIKWNAVTLEVLDLLEELIHALQKKNGWLGSNNYLNAEAEAKIAVYKYAVKHNIKGELKGYEKDWSDSIGSYIATPSPENYQKVIDFIYNSHETYQNQDLFQNSPDYRNTNNIDPLFTCY